MASHNMVPIKLTCVVLIVCMVVGAPMASAISCAQVANGAAPCIGYLRSGGPTVPPQCCSGLSALNSAAKTTPDRQQACQCLKNIAASIKGINYGLVASLPAKCRINIPYKITPSIDCKTVK
ncbi:lipid transfer protein 3 precursor [Tripterygium wilfordii]|uniref:Non-specific lipid-transfer protein n=1 Tax=Tripterygium wilfordii TaxID=458696 RepID=A0A7J7CT58_TRIWF|nr:non-specific lipid-transfer protein 1-like [Tripterygium wilfordii]KAF5737287.1 lipid transfer protein 3 precursor [Tripterygium wilfordii]